MGTGLDPAAPPLSHLPTNVPGKIENAQVLASCMGDLGGSQGSWLQSGPDPAVGVTVGGRYSLSISLSPSLCFFSAYKIPLE